MPMKYSPLAKAAFVVFLIAIASVIALTWADSAERSRQLRLVPAGLGVSQVLYAREESWGFGPGGNETGLIIFELPADVARNIQQQGIAYLNRNVSAQVADGRGASSRFSGKWTTTPARVEGSDDDTNFTPTYDIGKYLNRYGFGIPIDKKVGRYIDDALSGHGNFVDDDGRRLIIVMPEAGKLVYAYRG
jgi:hypothetical protein